MSLLQQVKKTKTAAPRRIFLYGVEGVGKSTFAANADKPIFIRTEDGLDDIDAEAFPLATSMSQVMQATHELATQEHEYKTLVLDSADWFEKLIWRQVCEDNSVDAITDIDFGKGYGKAMHWWNTWLDLADACRDAGMWVIVLAHCKIERYNDPNSDSYDRYMPRLHKESSAALREWANEVLFATYQVFTRSEELGFGKERNIAVGGNRVLKTTEQPAYKAKNRLGLPEEISLDWNEYYQFTKGGNYASDTTADAATAD